MRTESIAHLIRSLIIAAALAAVPRVSAQVDVTAWTNVEGTTIWARLEGMDGDRIILRLRGKTFRVPMNRLAPKSLEKARRMLNLPPTRAGELAGSSRAKPAATVGMAKSAPAPRNSRPATNEAAVLALSYLEIAAIPEPAEAAIPPPSEPVPAPAGELPAFDPQLPELASAVDASADGFGAVLPPRNSLVPSQAAVSGSKIRLDGRTAIAPAGVPKIVLTAIEAGNRLQTKYYKWGGGRASLEDTGYDCSGSVSYVLIKAGLLRSPLTSGSFTRYGVSGPGKWITIHARNGHVFMTICGLRLDTGGRGGRGESGPRWCGHMRGTSGFILRHPPGF